MAGSSSVVVGSGTTNSYGQQAQAGNNASPATSAVQAFLKIAPKKYYTILGTITKTGHGGANTNAVWQQPIPIIPAFCSAIDYTIQVVATLTLGPKTGATNGAVTLSPFAPYSGFSEQLTLGGAPPWPMMELTPFYLDQPLDHVDYDWNFLGGGQAYAGTTATPSYYATILDQGPIKNHIGGSTSLKPGATVTNSTTAKVAHTYKWTFRVRQQLQQKRHLLWGAVPFGDPENRPTNKVQLNSYLGKNPEQVWFVNSKGKTATTSVKTKTKINVYAKYELEYIDLLPPTVQSTPQPLVNLGLQWTPFSIQNLSSGTLQPITHRTAQIYTRIHHLLINGQLPVRANYFGLWDDQDQQSARWSFDSAVNTFTEWFDKQQREYRRYLTKGHYVVDMISGIFPEVPSVTPYDALMSPDESYATTFGVPVTPAMTTTLRLPATTAASTLYARVYSKGLVRVPY